MSSQVKSIRSRAHKTSLTRQHKTSLTHQHKTSLTHQYLGPLISLSCHLSPKEGLHLETLGSFLRLQDLPMPRSRLSRLPRLPCPSLQLLLSQLRQLNLLHNLVVRATPLTGTFRRQVMIELNSRSLTNRWLALSSQRFPPKVSISSPNLLCQLRRHHR